MGVRNESVTVGITAVTVSPSKKRRSVYCYNASTAAQVITVTVSSNQTAVAGAGYVLNPGSSVTLSNSEGYKVPIDSITAIADLAGGTLAVVEDVEGF